jgi:hypothetical protein
LRTERERESVNEKGGSVEGIVSETKEGQGSHDRRLSMKAEGRKQRRVGYTGIKNKMSRIDETASGILQRSNVLGPGTGYKNIRHRALRESARSLEYVKTVKARSRKKCAVEQADRGMDGGD